MLSLLKNYREKKSKKITNQIELVIEPRPSFGDGSSARQHAALRPGRLRELPWVAGTIRKNLIVT
jgi:hypothetical protein